MKSKFIITVLLFIVIASGSFIWWYTANNRDIVFDVKKSPLTVKITDRNKNTVATITSSTKLTLQDGTYYAYPSGNDVDQSAIAFTTSKSNTKITIDPSISLATLDKNLANEREAIQKVLFAKYPYLTARLNIDKGQLLRQADWYITTLSYKDSTNDSPKDVYKVILHKVNDTWDVVGSPQIVPTKYNFPDVPIDVIKSAYNLQKDSL